MHYLSRSSLSSHPSVNLFKPSECDPSQGKMSSRRPMIASVVWHRIASVVWHCLVWHSMAPSRMAPPQTYIHPMALADDISEFNLALPQIQRSTIQSCNCNAAHKTCSSNQCVARVLLCVPSFLIQPALKWRESRWWHSTCGAPSTHPPWMFTVSQYHLRELSLGCQSDFCEATMKKTGSSF